MSALGKMRIVSASTIEDLCFVFGFILMMIFMRCVGDDDLRSKCFVCVFMTTGQTEVYLLCVLMMSE
jgi:hypothetical protein